MATRFCTQCGQPIEGDGRFCTNCGAPIPPAVDPQPQPQPEPQQAYQQPPVEQQPQPAKQTYVGPKPKSYLALAILATIFCCLAFGIPAIVFAAKVDNYWNAGDYQGAQDASRKARNWTIAAIVTSLVIGILYYVLIAMGILASGKFLERFY